MTVDELRKALEGVPGDMLVIVDVYSEKKDVLLSSYGHTKMSAERDMRSDGRTIDFQIRAWGEEQ